MTTSTESTSEPIAKLIRTATLAICALCAVTTLPWIWMAIGHFGGFAWGLFGFELIVLLGCFMTMLVCLGKVQVGNSFPMAIACLVGVLLVAAVFGLYVDARAVVGDNPAIGPWVMRTLLFRLGMIMLLSLFATLDVYRRDTRSWGLLIRSVIFLAPVAAVLGWLKFNGMPAMSDGTGEPNPIGMVIFLLAGLTVGILLSVGGHFFIRSFEIALPESNAQADKSDTKLA